MLQLGSTLGPYVVDSLLAEGGMGAVYRARNRVTGQMRALKVVRPELAQKKDFVDRFVREATIASQLRHPNLVETLEPGIDGNIIYLPMELLEGETLALLLKRKKRLTPAEAAELLVPVTDAIQALHDRGVVHRDLKPMNIFVTRAASGAIVPKVIDLGTARDVEDEEHTRTGMVVGSPFYMAPEQAEGRRDIDGRADQYALGVIAYQMITGARPYESDDTRSALAKLLRGEPYAPPSRYFPGLHPSVEAVIVRSLERDRDRRFGRIAELGSALTAAAAGLPLPASAASPPTLITPSLGPAGASAPGAFVVPPTLGAAGAPASIPPTSSPLGTPGPFAPAPDATPPPQAGSGRPRVAVLLGAVVVLALLGAGAAAIAWNMSPTMTATPLAPRAATVAGAGTEAPVAPPVTIATTPAPTPLGATGAVGESPPEPASPTTAPTTAAGASASAIDPSSGAGSAPPAPAGVDSAASAGTAIAGGSGASAAGTSPGATGGTAASGSTAPGPAATTASATERTGSASGGAASASPTRTGSGSGSATGEAGTAATSTGSSGGTRSGSSGSSSRGSTSAGHGGEERGGSASHGAPCGAATGIPCLD